MNRFVLRLPDHLYQRVREESSRQGVSINQYLMYNITRAVTSTETLAFFAEKSRGADKKKARELLARVADRPPICKDDEIPESLSPRKKPSRSRPHARPPARAAARRVRASPR